MAKERLSMRKIREILRLKYDCNLTDRQIAKSCSVARSCKCMENSALISTGCSQVKGEPHISPRRTTELENKIIKMESRIKALEKQVDALGQRE